jgi:hypothetical protein
MKFNTLVTAFVLSFCVGTYSLQAQTTSQVYGDTLTRQTQTFFVTAEADWTTHNSQAVESNTSAATSSVSVGGYSGESRVLGVFFNSINQDLNFALNESSIRNNWNDLRLEARLGFIYPSVGVSMNQSKMVKAGETLTNFYGTGPNAGLGTKIPMTKTIMVEAEAFVSSTTAAHDKDGKDIEVGLRKEADIHATVDVTAQLVDFIIGYRAREYGVKVDDKEYKEVQSAPFAGLRLGMYF